MKKKKLSLTGLVIIIVTVFLLAVDVVLGVVLVNVSADGTKQVLNNKMLEQAQIAARLVNGDQIKSLTKADKENQTEAYTYNFDILSKFQASSDEDGGDLAYIYCLVKNEEGKIVFSIDADTSENTSIFLEEEAILTDALLTAINDGVAGVDPTPIVDRWGELYTAYAPIYCSDKVTIAGVIGVDVWANWYNDQIKMSSIAIASIGVVTITAGVLVALIITLNVRKKFNSLSNEMDSLESELQVLMNDIKLPQKVKEENEKNINPNADDVTLLKEQISIARKEIKEYIDYAKQREFTDSLTGINNRRAYFEKVKSINERFNNDDYNLIVLVYDLNGLKDINDTYGHEFGDIAITRAAETIQEVYGKESIFRIGGDEIVVILEGETIESLKRKTTLVEEILDRYNKTNKELPATLSLSLGRAHLDKSQDREFLDVFRRADKDMYEQKNSFYKKNKKYR